jgi:methionine-gamma-lyase
MKELHKFHMDTQCVHAGFAGDPTGAVVTPIYQVSTFAFRDVDHGADLFEGKGEGYIYTRMANPTVQACERAVAVLEGGFAGLGCGSGMAAIHTTFAALLRSGDHAVCSAIVYGPTQTLLASVMSRFGIESTCVDTADLNAVKRAMRPNTKLVYVETPGYPILSLSDLAAIADIAHAGGAKLAVDNTFMSPVLQRPLSLGADVIVHSMTKFLNGHADVVAGMIVVKTEEEYRSFRKILNQLGGVIDPFNSFLVSRGIKTLALRMERHCASAEKVARHLEKHPKVSKVNSRRGR